MAYLKDSVTHFSYPEIEIKRRVFVEKGQKKYGLDQKNPYVYKT